MGIPFLYKPNGLAFIVPAETGLTCHAIAEELTASCLAFNITVNPPPQATKIHIDLAADWRKSDAVNYLANSLGMYFMSLKDSQTRDLEGAGTAGAAIFCLPEDNGFSLSMSATRVRQVLGLNIT